MNGIQVEATPIPGLLVIHVPVHGDHRGWFKENWQREKMVAAGLPDFGPVQNNVSSNVAAGVTRGFHAEPWDKLISVVHGKVFGAWVDLRQGPNFGAVHHLEVGLDTLVYVPAGVGNAYQSLEPNTVYAYLVNDHWSAAAVARYTYCNLEDPQLAIPWPIPLPQAILSEADQNHPRLTNVVPVAPTRTLVLGSDGQLGKALRAEFPDAEFLGHRDLDITNREALMNLDLSGVEVIINAAAWTAVDAAEGAARQQCWQVNAVGPQLLTEVCRSRGITLVHISSDYVFDGSQDSYDELAPLSPIGSYGAAKAAGDLAVSSYPKHYLVRTSWVVGSGRNFVTTMAELAAREVQPKVVSDQVGRLTFTVDLAAGIAHLLRSQAPYGTYNLTNSGPAMSWYEVASEVYRLLGSELSPLPTTTAEYGRDKQLAPRPARSVLDLSKISATGFIPEPASRRLSDYLGELHAQRH